MALYNGTVGRRLQYWAVKVKNPCVVRACRRPGFNSPTGRKE
jgi:hypothetical protein